MEKNEDVRRRRSCWKKGKFFEGITNDSKINFRQLTFFAFAFSVCVNVFMRKGSEQDASR